MKENVFSSFSCCRIFKFFSGRAGFKMVVTEDAEMIGTIGGGIMEKDMIEVCT